MVSGPSGTTVGNSVLVAASLLEANLGSRRHRNSFPNCFQEGCMFFLLDFLLTLFLFHPFFFFFDTHCPAVTNVDLMVRVKRQLAWPAVGLSADLSLLGYKCEHNTTQEIPFLFSVTLLPHKLKSPSSRKFLFAFTSILEITSKQLQKIRFFSPFSQERSHLYSQPFKFRQVTESLGLQALQVVEMQVPVTQKITKDTVTDLQFKKEKIFSDQPTNTQHLVTTHLRADAEKAAPTLMSSLPMCKHSNQLWLFPILSTIYSCS